MIYYPLSTLMLGGIRDILVITTPHDAPLFRRLLDDGSQWGMRIEFAVQDQPNGIAQALIIAEEFLAGAPCALILGDNIFHGDGLGQLVETASTAPGATVFAYYVNDPERYGVVEFDGNYKPLRIVEKPVQPRSHWAVTGLYFYDGRASAIAAGLSPSVRGELEITDVNQVYLEQGDLSVERFGRGFAWLDAGTHESLLEASQFIHVVERRQGLKIACVEEIAFRQNFIDVGQLERLALPLAKTGYGQYLLRHLGEAVTAD